MPRHRLPSLSETFQKAFRLVICLIAFQRRCCFSGNNLVWKCSWRWKYSRFIWLLLSRFFVVVVACLIPSHSARLISSFLSLVWAPAVSGWSETRRDQPNVILVYQTDSCLGLFLTYITTAVVSNNAGPHFPYFWGMLSWGGSVLACLRCIHGENQTAMMKLRAQVQARSQPLIKAITS